MAFFAALPSLISAGAGIAGNIISGQNTAKAVKQAAQAQTTANDQAIGAFNGNNQRNAGLYAPFINSGTSALSQLDQLLGLGAPSAAPAVSAMSTTPSWSAYVNNNPDILAAYNDYGVRQGTPIDKFGEWHWNTFGQNEGRSFTPYGQTQPQGGAPAASSLSPAQQQQAAIDQLKASPLYQSLFHNGEQTTLANAAATGGLRGGNAERSLYNLGNDTLAQVIQQQVANLGGLAGAGQSATGNLAGLDTNSTGSVASLIGQGGANQAGGILGVNNANNGMIKGLTTGLSSLAGNSQLMSALGLGGGLTPTSTSNILGPQYNIPGQSVAPLSLNTSLDLSGLAF